MAVAVYMILVMMSWALQWFTKMGSIGGDVLSGIQTSIDKAEKNYKGLGDRQ